MTTQNTQAVLAAPMMSKIFVNAATTDDTWNANTLLDSLSGQQVGILMPNTTIDRVQAQYEAGCMAWRLQNAVTLAYTRYGVGVKDGLACFASSKIAPYSIPPNEILVTYPKPVAAAGSSNVLAWIRTTKGVELVEATSPNATATPMLSVVNAQGLGDFAFNSTLQSIHIQAEDGATVDSVEVISNDGGVVMTLFGGTRGNTLGAVSLEYNLMADNLNVPIGKGFILRVTTTKGA